MASSTPPPHGPPSPPPQPPQPEGGNPPQRGYGQQSGPPPQGYGPGPQPPQGQYPGSQPPPQGPPYGGYRPPGSSPLGGPEEPKGRTGAGAIAAIVVLGVLTLAFAGISAYLWATSGNGESDQPITLPGSLGGYASVPAKEIQLDKDKTAGSFEKTYHAAAMIREYQKGKGDTQAKLTILAVRTELPAPQPLYHSKDSKYAQTIAETKPGIWCVSRKLPEGDAPKPDNCIKATRGLSVMLGHYTYKGDITVDELAKLTDEAYNAIGESG